MRKSLNGLLFGILIWSGGVLAGNRVAVRDFGAVPDDGRCDIASVNRAIRAAGPGGTVVFAPGTYNLFNANARNDEMIVIDRAADLTLEGAVDARGEPVTRLELNVKAPANDLDTACPLRIYRSRNVTVKNLVFDNRPAFASAGVVTRTDPAADLVEIEVFPGLPHFDGMNCYSANSWDLERRELLPVPALTIGADPSAFKHRWERIPGGDGRRYRIQGMKFAALVRPGQGISWHFYVRNRGGGVFAAHCTGVTLENLRFDNVKGVAVGSQFCRDLVYRKITVKPVAPQLAAGARDAFHLVCNRGSLLVDEVYVKGVRWDPFNIKSKFCVVTAVSGRRILKGTVISATGNLGDLSGSAATFWIGERPTVLRIAAATWDPQPSRDEKNRLIRTFTATLAQDAPPTLQVGAKFTPQIWNFDRAVIRNSIFEGNCGRPILYQGENLTVTGCVFRNNAYASIALGPIDLFEGGFVRNATIAGNRFIGSTWLNTTPSRPHNGTIKIYQDCPEYFSNQPYNDGIVIRDNRFEHVALDRRYTPISIANAQNVSIADNRFADCTGTVYVDRRSTENITEK